MQFKLDTATCLKAPQDVSKALDLLEEFFDVISANGEYGHTKLLQHEIHTEDVPPTSPSTQPGTGTQPEGSAGYLVGS